MIGKAKTTMSWSLHAEEELSQFPMVDFAKVIAKSSKPMLLFNLHFYGMLRPPDSTEIVTYADDCTIIASGLTFVDYM